MIATKVSYKVEYNDIIAAILYNEYLQVMYVRYIFEQDGFKLNKTEYIDFIFINKEYIITFEPYTDNIKVEVINVEY